MRRAKHRESALAESEERFAKAFLASPDMMTITRLDDGMFYAVNPGFERTTGYTAAEAVGRSINDLGIWALPGGREDFIALLRREGVVRELEFAIRTRNRTIVYGRLSAAQIELEGVPAVIGIVHDITAQKRVEQRLAESEERFEKAFHSSREAIGISRLADSQIVAVNHRFEHLYGSPEERIVGRTSLELGLWAGDPGLREKILTRLRTEGRIRDMTVEVRTAGGETRTCNYSADVIEIGGEPHVIGFLRDITEQRRAEARILELNASLVELNASLEQRVRERTEALQFANRELESFSYSISHDLRAPVRAIGGFASILAAGHGATLNDEARRYLDLIDRNARRMGELIEDLLALARASRGALERDPVDMRRLVDGVIEDLGAGDRVAVAELPAVRGDASLLRQVWHNLIANSMKFSRDAAVPRIEVGGKVLADGMVEYSVRDNGCGFDMRHAGKLFEVFQRLHSEQEYEGTGAGLAIVQRIVARHGGRVAAEGSPGRGARFSFVLPA